MFYYIIQYFQQLYWLASFLDYFQILNFFFRSQVLNIYLEFIYI